MQFIFRICLVIAILLKSVVFAQQHATRDDGRKVILHNYKTWEFADSNFNERKINLFANRIEIPKLKPGEEIVEHSAYSLVYAEKYEQAKWVAYQLTSDETEKEFDRTDNFIPDPKIITGSANLSDYKNSGYDRGHLAPASDMGWSEMAMFESFYYSNMSPQEPSFNRGIWKKGEDLVRRWAKIYGNLYVVVGPVLKKNLPTIGPNKVAVPEQYFKVILDHEDTEPKAIAFLMKNEGSEEMLQSFAISVDSVEKITGIDFFPSLPDEEEKKIEKKVCLSCWVWPVTTKRLGEGPRRTGKLKACKGKNPDGSACKNYIAGSRQFCSEHIK